MHGLQSRQTSQVQHATSSGATEFETGHSGAITCDLVGLIEVPLEIGDSREQTIFDIGRMLLACRSAQPGVSLSKATASTQGGGTGAEVRLRSAIIPQIYFCNAVI